MNQKSSSASWYIVPRFSADAPCWWSFAAHHQRRNYFEVSLLANLDVEHPRDQSALEPRAGAAQEIEARPLQLHAAIEIDDAEILAKLPMRQRFECGELSGVPSVRMTRLSASWRQRRRTIAECSGG